MELPTKLTPKKTNRRKKRSKSGHKKPAINSVNVISKNISELSLDNNCKNNTCEIKQHRQKFNKENEDVNNHLIENNYAFKIFSSKKYLCHFFRRRSVNSKFINLKCYTNAAQTYVFTSRLTSLNKSRQVQLKNSQLKCDVQTDHVKGINNLTKNSKHTRKKRLDKQVKEELFPTYFTETEVEEGLKSGQLIKGTVRINPKNPQHAFVSNTDSTQPDYFIKSVLDRNRALEGDEIVLKLKPEEEWMDGQKTAEVVYILNEVHSRMCVGILKPLEHNSEYAVLVPRDKRLPTIHICSLSWPGGFAKKPKLYQNILFSVKILEWNVTTHAKGIIVDQIGLCDDLKAETLSILKEFCLDVTPFNIDQIKDYLPKTKNIPEKEFQYREDIRTECIFTIDPLMARDLDDAVSVKKLSNGHYEVGVHISDASYYLPEGSPLDDTVCKKATTIYLVNNIYHMLPVNLCLHCSLLPGEDKLGFSIFWEMDENGQIFSTRFARTILNSCVQLAYEHAQQMIDDPDKEFTADELPKIHNGFTPKDLSNTISVLQKIASNLREARIRNGSLRIDQIKLLFSINPQTGEPLDFMAYENKEAHRLIEEFMLLANISVAKKIYDSFPDIAFLRCHEPPKYTMLLAAQRCLETCGIHIDISSSGAISNSLKKYITEDCQGYCEKPQWTVDHVRAIANNCNIKKYNAKRAAEASSDLYLAVYVDSHQPYIQDCVVIDVKDRSLDVIVIKTGSCVRVHQNKCQGQPKWDLETIPSAALDSNQDSDTERNKKIYRLILTYPPTKVYHKSQTVIIEMFSIVKVKLSKLPNKYKLNAYMLRPKISHR
ncbi:dis3 like 3'-5' exoribonuclease 2 isoform X2 [Rhynchophorus ferrugineus]|uniref:dis3 like 3'-5' exoribonuclease 2 isoform X2 n=1 Tax=Rhynchophorus ferrugineus TaxID=354439 RepID=UPI003FCCB00B